MIRCLCILGVGLIGGSLALALKRRGYCQEIVGGGRSEANLQLAQKLGAVDRYELNPRDAVNAADVVVLAVPLGAMQDMCKRIQPSLSKDTILTDVGSAKASVVEAVRQALGNIPPNFVPGHPIAGTENSGVQAAFAELFEAHRVILTPLPNTNSHALKTVTAMWEASGAFIEHMDVAHHDWVLAATSHLPHMLAFGLVDSLSGLNEHDSEEIFRYAAGGFRDFTRIASSDPVMWRDICLSNRDAILAMMERYRDDLDEINNAIEARDASELLEIFRRAKQARDRFCH